MPFLARNVGNRDACGSVIVLSSTGWGRDMRLVAVVVAFAVMLVSCAEDLSSGASGTDETPSVESPDGPVPGSGVRRCIAGGTDHAADAEGYDTLDAALDAAADLAGLDVTLLRAEDQSDTWIAGTSDDPRGVIELRQPDGGDVWFIDSVASCHFYNGQNPEIPAELPSGEITVLRSIVLVEGAEVGDIYTTGLAADTEAFADLWQELGLVGAAPVIDFNTRVVLYFGAVESSSCPLGPVEAIVYNQGNQSIHPLMSPVATAQESDSGVLACTADARRHAVLVAVERADLPDGAFSLWISEDDPPGCCLDGLTFVAASELNPPAGAPFDPLGADGDLGVGETRIAYDVLTHCGVEWLARPINGQRWHAVDLANYGAIGIDAVPPQWGEANDLLDLLVTLIDQDTLEVTTATSNVVVTYVPDTTAPGGR